jgi:hypothetical protein
MGVSFKTIDSKCFTQNNRNDKFKYKITLKKHVWHIKTKIAVSYNECNNNLNATGKEWRIWYGNKSRGGVYKIILHWSKTNK